MSILYLVKDNNSLISHCNCKDARISDPGQMSCPWCGCGWLFGCTRCRKAFTFARAQRIDSTWEEMAWEDLIGFSKAEPDPDEVREIARSLRQLHQGLVPGERYVYFDGLIVGVNEQGIKGRGRHARHDLDYVPQVAALQDRSRLNWVLQNMMYWEGNALPRR